MKKDRLRVIDQQRAGVNTSAVSAGSGAVVTIPHDPVSVGAGSGAGLTVSGQVLTLTGPFVPLAAPLTSTSWDGDAFSTAAKTLIDLSAVFGAPAGIKAVLVRVLARDSASAASTGGLGVMLSPNDTAIQGPLHCRCDGRPNDVWEDRGGIVPCDANGDIYYQTYASGAGTLDVYLQIWGYWI